MDNYIINPKTQRLVKKGGKTHKRLVKEGVLERIARLDQTEIKEGDDISRLRQELEAKTPPHKKVVKIKNKLVQRERQADQYFLDIIDDLLPESPPKLVRQRGKYRVVLETETEESDEEASD